MTKNILMVVLSALTLMFMVAVQPASAANSAKIAYANLQKALNECDAGIKAKETLKQEAQKLEAELSEKQAELKKMKDEIDKKGSVWNKETKEEKERDLRARSQEFQKQFMEYGDELNKKKQDTEARIIEELRDTVEEVAKKQGYSFVFERSVGGLLYAPEDADLTDEVIKAYNKKFREKGK